VPQLRRLSGIEDDTGPAFRAAASASVTGPLARRVTIIRLQGALGCCRGWRVGSRAQIGRIKIILTGDANEREQSIAASVGEGSAHTVRVSRLRDGTNRPI